MRLIVLVCFVAALIPAFGQVPKSSVTYEALISKSRTFIVEKQPQEAVKVSEEAMSMNDKRWEAYVTAASAYSAQQLYDDTVSMLQTALARAPEDKKPAIRSAISEARQQLAAQASPKPSVSAPSSGQVPPAATTQAEAVLWRAIENSTRAEDYQGYLSKYPDGTFAPAAKARLDAITNKQADEAAQQKRAKESSLEGAGWQGTVGQLDATLKFKDGQNCQLIIVRQRGLDNKTCTWQRIGNALYIHLGEYCWDNNGWDSSDYVLTVQGEAVNGVVKGCKIDNGSQISLKRSE
jgi:tetratricopeptide (TPR) repeat protein